MRAIDTNIVVRYLTGDDPEQFAIAQNLVDTESTWVGITVVLETAWVLRSNFGQSPAQVVRSIRSFAGLPLVTIESAEAIAAALAWVEHGMAPDDALHLARSADCRDFVTFDQPLARLAVKAGAGPVTLLSAEPA